MARLAEQSQLSGDDLLQHKLNRFTSLQTLVLCCAMVVVVVASAWPTTALQQLHILVSASESALLVLLSPCYASTIE